MTPAYSGGGAQTPSHGNSWDPSVINTPARISQNDDFGDSFQSTGFSSSFGSSSASSGFGTNSGGFGNSSGFNNSNSYGNSNFNNTPSSKGFFFHHNLKNFLLNANFIIMFLLKTN